MGVWIYKADEKAQGYPTGHWTNAALLLFVAVGCAILVLFYHMKNGKIKKSGGGRLYRY